MNQLEEKGRGRVGRKGWLAISSLILVVVVAILSLSGLAGRLGAYCGWSRDAASATALLEASFELDGQGLNVDSIAFWEATNPEETLMFVTAKGNSLVEIWQFPFDGSERPWLGHALFGSSQVNGVAVDQQAGRLFVTIANPADTVAVFSLPELALDFSFVNGQSNLGTEPGIAVWPQKGGGGVIYLTSDVNQSVHLYDEESGEETAVVVLDHESEMLLVDAFYEVVYIPDESGRRGILAYAPDLSPYRRNGVNAFGAGVFQQDAEGIVLYRCQSNGEDNGRGFIVASDQRSPATDLEFFDRLSWQYLGNLRLAGVGNTDGLGSSQRPLPGYPAGLLTAINDDHSVAGIGWDRVLPAMGLSCEAGSS